MDDDIDIYEDLPSFSADGNENSSEKNKELVQKCTDLEQKVSELTVQIDVLKKANRTLEVNLSSLLKTARAEISRKDKMIADVRRELDNAMFRRGNYKKLPRAPIKTSERAKPSEHASMEDSPYIQVPDATEFMCNNPTVHSEDEEDTEQKYKPDKIVNTLFNERLRKRIMEEEKLEKQQKEQLQSLGSDATKSIKSNVIQKLKKIESTCNDDKENHFNVDSNLKEDVNICSRVPSQNGTNNLNALKEGEVRQTSISVHKVSRKRSIDNDHDLISSKRMKCEKDENRNREQCLDNKDTDQKCTENQVHTSVTKDKQQRMTNDCKTNRNTKENIINYSKADDIRHKNVTSRLKLLSEGVDPDINESDFSESNSRHSSRNTELRKDKYKGNNVINRNRSRSNERDPHYENSKYHRSRSRSLDRKHNDWKYGRSNCNRYGKHKDNIDKRRSTKYINGYISAESSNVTYDLRGRLVHTFDERTIGGEHNSHRSKSRQDRRYKRERSKTPASRRSGSKDSGKHTKRIDSCDRMNNRSSKSKIINRTADGTQTNNTKCSQNKGAAEKAERISLYSLEEDIITDQFNSDSLQKICKSPTRNKIGAALLVSNSINTKEEEIKNVQSSIMNDNPNILPQNEHTLESKAQNELKNTATNIQDNLNLTLSQIANDKFEDSETELGKLIISDNDTDFNNEDDCHSTISLSVTPEKKAQDKNGTIDAPNEHLKMPNDSVLSFPVQEDSKYSEEILLNKDMNLKNEELNDIKTCGVPIIEIKSNDESIENKGIPRQQELENRSTESNSKLSTIEAKHCENTTTKIPLVTETIKEPVVTNSLKKSGNVSTEESTNLAKVSSRSPRTTRKPVKNTNRDSCDENIQEPDNMKCNIESTLTKTIEEKDKESSDRSTRMSVTLEEAASDLTTFIPYKLTKIDMEENQTKQTSAEYGINQRKECAYKLDITGSAKVTISKNADVVNGSKGSSNPVVPEVKIVTIKDTTSDNIVSELSKTAKQSDKLEKSITKPVGNGRIIVARRRKPVHLGNSSSSTTVALSLNNSKCISTPGSKKVAQLKSSSTVQPQMRAPKPELLVSRKRRQCTIKNSDNDR
ncbi:uncharacterized protein LOC105701220 isoform X2 [Orussus abietinus]|uniref:uncharacterized protein LOC105701220 isoform X2 n=1 Tax=Orussus abietinus TaxID=222816 RepID=UPI000626E13A|nr:uncharacterized protein LOC105701220 isoform X2 [Orussus abietinus]